VFEGREVAKRKQQDVDPDAWLKDYSAYFDPKYRGFIAANKQGRLALGQFSVIKQWWYRMPPDEEAHFRQSVDHETPGDRKRALVLFIVSLLTALFAFQFSLEYGLCLVLPLWLFALFALLPRSPSTHDIGLLVNMEATKRKERLLANLSGGKIKIIRVEGVPNYETTDSVRIDRVAYSVEPPLYRWLSENSHHVAVYAIEGWYPQYALSVEPLDVPIPLTPEERLQTVVGVNSEGELVYADDPAHEDAHPLETT